MERDLEDQIYRTLIKSTKHDAEKIKQELEKKFKDDKEAPRITTTIMEK